MFITRILSVLVFLGLLVPYTALAAPIEYCAVQNGMKTECSGRTEGNSADFSGQCFLVPNIVLEECPKVYQTAYYNLGQSASLCNRNSYDPSGWRNMGAACNFDQETANEACKTAGFDGATSISVGRYSSPKNNGITKWEPAQNRFVTYNARSMGNQRINGMYCYGYRYVKP